MKKIVFAAGFCLAAAPVLAQGLAPFNASPEAAPSTWDGYYFGLAVTSGDVTFSDRTTSEEEGTQGFGLQFGYLRDMGTFVVGGEFAYVGADFDDVDDLSLDSARLKAIAGYDAGRFLPYAFVGLSNVEAAVDTSLGEAAVNETTVNYGLGGRIALGAEGRVVAGLEYLVEEVDDFGGSGIDIDNNDVSLRFDFKY
jgi:outer membrane immunogenic protein